MARRKRLTGPDGPAGPRPTIDSTSGLSGDGSSASPLAINDAYFQSRYLSATAPVLPNVTVAERDAIASPVAGQMVFNSDSGDMNFYDGAAWRSASSGFRISRANTALQSHQAP